MVQLQAIQKIHKLEAVCRREALTDADMAELAGVHVQVIRNVFARKDLKNITGRLTTVESATLIANALDLKLYDIFSSVELTYVGRPPLTGHSKQKSPLLVEDTCKCGFILPKGVSCDLCSSVLI